MAFSDLPTSPSLSHSLAIMMYEPGSGGLICCADGRKWSFMASTGERDRERHKETPPYWLSSGREPLPHTPPETCCTRRQESELLLTVRSCTQSRLTRSTKLTSPCQLVYGPCLSSLTAAVFSSRLGGYRQASRRPLHCVPPRLSSHPHAPWLRRTHKLERFISFQTPCLRF